MKKLLKLVCAAVAVSLAATSAQATEYTLTNEGSPTEPAEWGTPGNWSPEDVPGSSDSFKWAPANLWDARSAYVALDHDYEIGSMLGYYRYLYLSKSANSVAENVALTFHAGLGEGQPQWYVLGQGVKLVVLSTASILGSNWESKGSKFDLGDGSVVEIYGSISSRRITWNVGDATLLFQPSGYSQTSSCEGDIFNVTDGEVSFPVGLSVTGGDSSKVNEINQSGGAVAFGGNFTSGMPWTYTWSGGTLNITNDCAFGANIALAIPASASVTLDVAVGKTFSAPGFTAGSTATITKTGVGFFAMAPMDAAISVTEGGVALNADTYDLSNVSFSEGTVIKLAHLGGRVDVTSPTLANATFMADLTGVTVGTIVFYSTNPDVLAKVQSDLNAPEGLAFATRDGALYLASQTAYDKTYNTSGEISDMPEPGSKIAIDGDGIVVTLSSSDSVAGFKALGSIDVKNGATLSIRTDVDGMPPIILNMNAVLEITNNATVVLANAANLSCVAMQTHVPVLSIASGSTLSVPGGMKFKNVDFRLYGVVTKPNNMDLSPVFGYAENGETSYFALTVDGGTFDLHSTGNSGQSNDDHAACGSVSIICPESGGTVVPVGQIILRNARRTVENWSDFGSWEFGVNNPTSVPFDVLVDGTMLDCAAYFHASGAAHLTLVNGACIRRNSSCLGHDFSQAIQNSATVDVGEGCYIDFTTGASVFAIDSQSAVDTVTVHDGGVYAVSHNSSGWGLGVFVSDGGVLGVTKIYKSSSGDPRPRTDLLLGFGSARLDGDLVIASVNMGTGNYDWDRHTTMANIPFSGMGDVTITNGVPAYPFTVTMQSGANTATGTISVAKADGDAETKLYFANGANWAGTVVADGNVALTNLVDASAVTTNAFGTLDLVADFTFRAWKENGAVVSNDVINVGRYTGTGRLTPISATAFVAGDKVVVGKIAKGAQPPRVARGWLVETEPIDGDGANDLLVLTYGKGMLIMFK